MRIGLVGCVKTKSVHPAPAADLYTSPLFRGRRAFVEASCDDWFVLSAKHGLLSTGEVVSPYDETLKAKSAVERRRWAERVLHEIDAIRPDAANDFFEIHAGAEYRDFGLVAGLRSRRAQVEIPAEGLSQGEQLAFYQRQSSDRAAVPRSRPTGSVRTSGRGRSGAYAALADHLREASTERVQLSFSQLEEVLGRPLPASAQRHRAWWSNDSSGAHSHALAWTGTGWIVDAVDLKTRHVGFRRIAGAR